MKKIKIRKQTFLMMMLTIFMLLITLATVTFAWLSDVLTSNDMSFQFGRIKLNETSTNIVFSTSVIEVLPEMNIVSEGNEIVIIADDNTQNMYIRIKIGFIATGTTDSEVLNAIDNLNTSFDTFTYSYVKVDGIYTIGDYAYQKHSDGYFYLVTSPKEKNLLQLKATEQVTFLDFYKIPNAYTNDFVICSYAEDIDNLSIDITVQAVQSANVPYSKVGDEISQIFNEAFE